VKEENHYSGYKGIFKSTFLFGFVQVFKAIIGVVNSKFAAIFLGADGIGILGIFNSTITLIQTGAGLGISKSAVREISQANKIKDVARFSKTITVTNRVIYFTSLLGCTSTIVLSPWLSEWTMGDRSYTLAYIFISLVVGFRILSEGQLAILTGMRQLKALAKASMIGSVVGLITVVPLYFFFGKNGIVPALIITAFSALFFSTFYVRKIKYNKSRIPFRQVFQEASPMVRMGVALMFASFLFTVVRLIISAYIRHKGGFAEVGFFIAGTAIISRYFGMIITALSKDYYPRIAAIHTDNKLLQDELNKQSAVSLILSCPLIVVFLFFLPYIVPLLYSTEFIPTTDFVKYAVWGTLITMVSNQVDMILVVKFQTRIFIIIAIVIRIIQVIISIVSYNYFGLVGIGISQTVIGIIHMLIMTTIVYKLYRIKLSTDFLKIAAMVTLFSICALLSNELINHTLLKFIVGVILSIVSVVYCLKISKNKFDIDFVKLVINKFKIKKT
jgi:O-antigen/teichoic acid export membrane protein